MFCPNCGAEIGQGGVYCQKCGAAIANSANQAPLSQAQINPSGETGATTDFMQAVKRGKQAANEAVKNNSWTARLGRSTGHYGDYSSLSDTSKTLHRLYSGWTGIRIILCILFILGISFGYIVLADPSTPTGLHKQGLTGAQAGILFAGVLAVFSVVQRAELSKNQVLYTYVGTVLYVIAEFELATSSILGIGWRLVCFIAIAIEVAAVVLYIANRRGFTLT